MAPLETKKSVNILPFKKKKKLMKYCGRIRICYSARLMLEEPRETTTQCKESHLAYININKYNPKIKPIEINHKQIR